MTTTPPPRATPPDNSAARARPRRGGRGLPLAARLLLLVGLLLVAAVALIGTNKNAADAVRAVVPEDTPVVGDLLALAPPQAPQQPINFPHPVHLAAGITCRHCHNYTDTSPVAQIASAQLCMECHRVVATDRPEIQKLTGYYERGEEIPWVRVYNVPDFVYFSHRMHIAAGVQCAACHGNMQEQVKTYQANTLNMGFCITCHRANEAPIECYTCHK